MWLDSKICILSPGVFLRMSFPAGCPGVSLGNLNSVTSAFPLPALPFHTLWYLKVYKSSWWSRGRLGGVSFTVPPMESPPTHLNWLMDEHGPNPPRVSGRRWARTLAGSLRKNKRLHSYLSFLIWPVALALGNSAELLQKDKWRNSGSKSKRLFQTWEHSGYMKALVRMNWTYADIFLHWWGPRRSRRCRSRSACLWSSSHTSRRYSGWYICCGHCTDKLKEKVSFGPAPKHIWQSKSDKSNCQYLF